MSTPAGEGWRRDFGIAVITIFMITMFASLYIVYTRCHIPPLNTRSKIVNYMMSLSTIPMIITPIIDIRGEAFIPCSLYFWALALCSGPLVGALIAQFWRILRMYGYELLKKQYKYGKVKLSTEQSTHLKNYQKWHSDRCLLLFQLCNMTFITLAFLPIFYYDPFYNSNHYACHIQQPPCM